MIELVELAGGRVASYETIGSGRPTLAFPGGPGFAAAYMRGDAELFADTLQCYLIDPHGSGSSTPPADPSAYSPEGHAAFYDEVRRAIGLDSVMVLGHSFGATTALVYSALSGEAVSACIAVAPFGIGPDSGAETVEVAEAETLRSFEQHADARWYPEARATMDDWTERILETEDPGEAARMMATVLPLYTAHPDRPDVAEALEVMKKHLTADLAAMKAWENGLYQTIDLRPLLPRVACPTLVVAGEQDFICGPAQARPIAKAIADVRLEIITDCGHFPVVEAPSLYKATVERFISA